MQEIIEYMKHRGWTEDGQVIRNPRGMPFSTWESAIKQVIFEATYTG